MIKTNRWDIINFLIKTKNYKTFLEIGTQHGRCFSEIDIEHKECVDPNKNYELLTHHMTSDAFFEQNTKLFDIIFVDGLHSEEQCTKDIINSLNVLNNNGTIIVHDCLPPKEQFIRMNLCGTVYRSIINLRCTNPNVFVHVVDTDMGCGIITKKPSCLFTKESVEGAKMYSFYEANKHELMNIITTDEFYSIYS